MPISGLPGKPTKRGKSERSHQTLIRFLHSNQSASLDQFQARINTFREHYNKRRPHQALGPITRATAWEMLEHTPALKPIPLVVLEAKASEYRQLRHLKARDLDRSRLTVSKTG